MMIILFLISLAIACYLWMKVPESEEVPKESNYGVTSQTYVHEIITEQTELNNAAFAARKALIEEALHRSSINHTQFHDKLNRF